MTDEGRATATKAIPGGASLAGKANALPSGSPSAHVATTAPVTTESDIVTATQSATVVTTLEPALNAAAISIVNAPPKCHLHGTAKYLIESQLPSSGCVSKAGWFNSNTSQ